MPTNTSSHTEGTIVSWDHDLVMTARYTMRLNSSTGPQGVWSMNLRGIDYNGDPGSYSPDKVCVVGMNTLGTNNSLNYSFILCFDRNTSGVLTTDWNKIIRLNLWNTGSTNPGLNPGWEHIEMDTEYIYAATRGSRMVISNNSLSDNQYTTAAPMYAAIAKFRISDGAIMWIKKFTFGSTGSFQSAKGITKITLSNSALYASISVPETTSEGTLKNTGYDYLKINPANGDVAGSVGLSTSATMPNSSSLGGYEQVSGTSYDLTTTYVSGSSNIVTVSESLEFTDLNNTVSNQYGINPTWTKYT